MPLSFFYAAQQSHTKKAPPHISCEAVKNALNEIRREETHMRFPAQYRPSETSHISLNDYFAAVQIDFTSEGGSRCRLTRSSLTPRISSRTLFIPSFRLAPSRKNAPMIPQPTAPRQRPDRWSCNEPHTRLAYCRRTLPKNERGEAYPTRHARDRLLRNQRVHGKSVMRSCVSPIGTRTMSSTAAVRATGLTGGSTARPAASARR